MPNNVKTGLDLVGKAWPKHLNRSRIGLLIHSASINRNFKQPQEIFLNINGLRLAALFGPQHGIRGETQDNMIEWKGYKDKKTGTMVFSLYGKKRRPDSRMLKDVDVMVCDLQDVGSRYYTYIWTLALVMEACQDLNKSVVVLDRPNPIGGHITEGPILHPEYASFVGLLPLPIRHGMTFGEIARYLGGEFYTKLDLHIVRMKGWQRKMWFDDTGLPWVPPSPNMPTTDTTIVYPGACLFEGTNLSEGRGTTKPFEIFGAPFVDPDKLIKRLADFRLPGVIFRPLHFLPTFQKYSGKLCGGAQIHVADREKFRPFKTAVALLKAVYELYPKAFLWKMPPYEYENRLLPIDILAGTDRVRKDIEEGTNLRNMEAWWKDDLSEFDKKLRRKYLLY